MKKIAMLFVLLAGAAHAQSGPHWLYGYLPGQQEIENQWKGKGDRVNGQLTTPTIRTGLGLPAWSLADSIPLSVLAPNTTLPAKLSYDPTGTLFDGPVTITRNSNGLEHHAGGLEVSLNSTATTCGNGGSYQNPVIRGAYGARDLVGVCANVTQPTPITSNNASTFVNDPANINLQETALSPAYTQVPTGLPAQGTKVVLGLALTSAQVAQLQLGMVAETNNLFTGFVTGWDPGGTWITVDQWVAIGSNPMLIGFSPAAYQGSNPYVSVTINIISQVYGENLVVEVPPNSYDQAGHTANALGQEIAIVNNGSAVTMSEFDGYSDVPRLWGSNVGIGANAGSGNGNGAAGYTTLENINIGFQVMSATSYAGFVYRHNAGVPGEAGFVTQQDAGVAYESKPGARRGLRTWSVDSQTGLTTRGLSANNQAANTEAWSTPSTGGAQAITPTGSGTITAQNNMLGAPMVANADYSAHGNIGCSDGTNRANFDVTGLFHMGATPSTAVTLSGNALGTNGMRDTVGTVTGWSVSPAVDTTTGAPYFTFGGPANVTCTGTFETMRIH